MRSDQLSCVRMNAPAPHTASARHLLCLAASILGLMVLAFGVAPGTVLASSATDIYTEEPPPPTPSNNGNGGNGGNNGTGGSQGNGGNGGNASSGDTGSDSSDGSGSGYTGSGSGSGSDDTPDKQKKFSDGNYNPATDSDKDKPAKKAEADEDSDDSTISAAPASGDDGGGGSALPWIIALVIGIPLIGGGGYYLWQRYRSPDDETREQLKTALGSNSTGTGSSTGS